MVVVCVVEFVFTGVFVVVINGVAVDVVTASVVVAHVPLHAAYSEAFTSSVYPVLLTYVHITFRFLYPVSPQAAGHSVNSP